MYEFSAKVVEGSKVGRQIGFPTANLDSTSHKINHGVYLVKVIMGKRELSGLLHFGPKKTFDNKITAEVYIDQFNANIYGKKINIKIVKRIRGIKRFKNINSLISQLNKDLLYLRKEEKC